jgi:hypothetical protein
MLRIIILFVSLAAMVRAEDHRFEMNDVVRSARLIDAIHACLIFSREFETNDLRVEYLGVTALKKPPNGFLQGLPGSWRIGRKAKEGGGDGEKGKLVFYLSVSSQNSAFECELPQNGKFRMVAINESGKDCSSDNILIDGKQLPVKVFVAGLLSKFNYSN